MKKEFYTIKGICQYVEFIPIVCGSALTLWLLGKWSK